MQKIYCHGYSLQWIPHTPSPPAPTRRSSLASYLQHREPMSWKLSKGELVYPKWYASSSHIYNNHRERVSRPIPTNTPLHSKCNKVILLPLRIPMSLKFSLFHNRVLRTRFAQPSFLFQVALSYCFKHTRITPWYTLLWGDNSASLASLLHTALLLVSSRPRDRLWTHHAYL